MNHLQSIDEVVKEFNIDNFTHFDSGDMVVDGEGIKNWLRTTLTTREQAIREEEQSEAYAQGWNEGQQAITKKIVEKIKGMKEPNIGKENKPFHHRTRYNQALDDIIKVIK